MNTIGKKRQARRAHPLRRLGRDAHRGLGRQHRHPHPRRPPVPQPAALRAGRRPRPAPAQLRRQPDTAGSSPSTPRSTACRSRSSPATGRSPAAPKPAARGRGPGPARTVGARDPTSPSSTATASSCPTRRLHADFDEDSALHLDQADGRALGRRTRESSAPRAEVDLDDIRNARTAAGRVRARQDADRAGGVLRRPRRRRSGHGCSRSSSRSAGNGSTECVTTEPGVTIGYLLLTAGRCRSGARRCSARSSVCQAAARAGADADASAASTPRARPTRCASSPARS